MGASKHEKCPFVLEPTQKIKSINLMLKRDIVRFAIAAWRDQPGDKGGWCKGVCDGRVHPLHTNTEHTEASNVWDKYFENFEEDLYTG